MKKRIVCYATVLLLALGTRYAFAEPNNPNNDWFCQAKYGVFVHYLQELQNNPASIQSLGKKTSWDKCVDEFDVELFADQMAQAGAGYVIFTTHQRTRFLIAPNATFDRLTGYQPGEACSRRDLIGDLYEALHRRNIPLMLYWTGNGPSRDSKAVAALGYTNPVNKEYVEKWATVVEEYGLRYGEKIAGWWVDGCYPFIGYDDEKLGVLVKSLKAGNPKRIVALNPGVEPNVRPYSRHEDFTAGEQNHFRDQPCQRWIQGEQWHILSFLGNPRAGNYLSAGWGEPGSQFTKQAMAEYVFDVNQAQGVVSIDVLLYRDGSLDRSQLEVLKSLRPRMAKMKKREPIPAGNLAFRKPAKLLCLNGSRELFPSNANFAKNGVDGKHSTSAQASMEWPWTYEVDLLKLRDITRIKVSFPHQTYATKLRVQVSNDHKTWHGIASADDLKGQPYEVKFTPMSARYVRVSALKPDGPKQEGTQMGIAELEVYE